MAGQENNKTNGDSAEDNMEIEPTTQEQNSDENLNEGPYDWTLHHYIFDKKYQVQIKEEEKDQSEVHGLRIYTDGF
ncbi:uncharacterized protein LOC113516623 [Galleria mellonella]|uniref:Uncharacterized protein LOC113516623 n=1 Tax=Galleria mellonella TaxID=7137 RepID=A0A6J1WNU1_GALME|nr:uncharacterized protein LOC113516623 [Galleria mellonella]